MKLHIVSLPHTQITQEYISCAYTMKVRKMAPMMRALGYEVILYGSEECDVECDEHVTLVTKEDQKKWFGEPDLGKFYPITWGTQDECWVTMNARAVEQIKKRAQPRDMLLLIAGVCQQQIAEALPELMPCEWGIGYEGTFAPYRCYESYAWMHHLYGKHDINNGRWFDVVIPNFFDTSEFTFMPEEKEDYLLYIGRIISRKGPHVAAQIAERVGLPLKVAGQGVTDVQPGKIISPEIVIEGDHCEYLGAVGLEERKPLMAKAKAVIVPTLYIEPFGGVAVEAMLSGTPVIASDFGAFTETVIPGISGYRFHTLAEGAEAVAKCAELDPAAIKAYAEGRYSLEAIGPQYDKWFNRLQTLYNKGWYE